MVLRVLLVAESIMKSAKIFNKQTYTELGVCTVLWILWVEHSAVGTDCVWVYSWDTEGETTAGTFFLSLSFHTHVSRAPLSEKAFKVCSKWRNSSLLHLMDINGGDDSVHWINHCIAETACVFINWLAANLQHIYHDKFLLDRAILGPYLE